MSATCGKCDSDKMMITEDGESMCLVCEISFHVSVEALIKAAVDYMAWAAGEGIAEDGIGRFNAFTLALAEVQQARNIDETEA